MLRSALPLMLLATVGACTMPGAVDPTRPSPAREQALASQNAAAIAKAQARLTREQAQCTRGNKRACARATAAQAVLDDLNRPVAPQPM